MGRGMMCMKCGAIAVVGSEVCRAHGGREGDLRRAEEEAEEQAVKLEYMKGERK